MKDKTSYTVEQVKAVDWCRCGNLDVDRDRLMATAVELKAALARVSELEKALVFMLFEKKPRGS